MTYWLNITTLGHRVPAEEERLGLPIVVRANVFCKDGIFRLGEDMLGIVDVNVARAISNKLDLTEVNKVHYLPYDGGSSVQDFNSIPNSVFRLKSFGDDNVIGLYKGNIFCNKVAKDTLKSIVSGDAIIQIEDDDVYQFLWDGKHLVDASPAVKQILLKSLRRNWVEIV